MFPPNWFPIFERNGDVVSVRTDPKTLEGSRPIGEINDLMAAAITQDGELRTVLSA